MSKMLVSCLIFHQHGITSFIATLAALARVHDMVGCVHWWENIQMNRGPTVFGFSQIGKHRMVSLKRRTNITRPFADRKCELLSVQSAQYLA